MKVIDLLNKIANGKEVPKKIKYQGSIFTYNKEVKDYETWFEDNSGLSLFNLVYITPILNDEVEIIEDTPKEDKKIEKLDLQYKDIIYNPNFKTNILMYCDNLQFKINEIIDKLNGE